MIFADAFILAIALAWIIFASICDIKKREIPNFLSFSLIATAIGIRAIHSILTMQADYFLYGITGLAAFYIIANALYYCKFFAGGDVKLLTALGPVLGLDLLFNFASNAILVGAVYGLVFSIFLAAGNSRKFAERFSSLLKETAKIRYSLVAISAIILAVSLISGSILIASAGILFLVAPYFYSFIKSVEDSSLIKTISPKKLTEGDWLVSDVRIGKKKIKANFEGLTREEIKLLEKSNKKITIKEGIPFVPVFFFAFILTQFGNMFYLLAEIMASL